MPIQYITGMPTETNLLSGPKMYNAVLIFIFSISGIFAYFVDYGDIIGYCVALVFIVGFIAAMFAYNSMKFAPVFAVYLFVLWRFVPLTFVFLGAFASVWLSLNILDYLPITFPDDSALEDLVKAEKATLKSLTTTAITTLLAAVVLDAARDPESWFWPAQLHKRALKAAFHKHKMFEDHLANPDRAIRHPVENIAAAYIEENTHDNQAPGWSFKSRRHRATVIRDAIKKLKEKNIKV